MAPKQGYKVHSLSQHVANTNKGISADHQRPKKIASLSAPMKKESSSNPNDIFADNDDDDESESASSDDSDSDGHVDILKKLAASPFNRAKKSPAKATPASGTNGAVVKDKNNAKAVDLKSNGEPASKVAKTNGTSSSSAATTSATSSTSSDGDSDDSSEEESGPAKSAGVKVAEVSSSDEDSSESDEEDGAAAKPKVNGQAAASSDDSSSSEEESDNDSDDGSDDETDTKKPSKALVAPPADDSGSDASSSESEDEDEAADESMHISDRDESGVVAAPKFIAPDFMIRRGGDNQTSGKDVAKICDEANLAGKQFWYFTVPSDIPISVIQNMEIPIGGSQSSDAIFNHNGDAYGVSFDRMTPKSNIQILIPSKDGSQYQSSKRPVDEVMQIKRITTLAVPSTASDDGVRKRAPRPQPKGLKARWQPMGVNTPMGQIGSDSSSDGGSDAEMVDASPLPSLPSNSQAKKSKSKRKHSTSEEEAAAASSQLVAESMTAGKQVKKQKTSGTSKSEATPTKSGKKSKSSAGTKGETPVSAPLLNHEAGSTAKKVTPVPLPAHPKAINAPMVPVPPTSSAGPPDTPSHTQTEKKSKKKSKAEKAFAPDSSQASTGKKKATPIPVPMPSGQ